MRAGRCRSACLLCTPIAVFGAFGALWLRALENNVYAQIGLVMLIGLSAKNAILIVEFAKVEYEKGKSVTEAALIAARLRLRPILMTSFAFILGVVPLVLSSGSRRARKDPARHRRPRWDAGGECYCDLLDSGCLHLCGDPGASS